MATVHTFSQESKPFPDVPIGTVATAWVDPSSGDTIILEFPQTLYFGERMSHSLLCPNQLRAFGLIVSDVPRQFDATSTHSIRTSNAGDDATEIPLEMAGVISYFSSHKPSANELETCKHVVMCADTPWDPNHPSFERQEQAALFHAGIAEVVGEQIELDYGDANDGGGDVTVAAPESRSDRFEVLPLPGELLTEEELTRRWIAAINIEGYEGEETNVDTERTVAALVSGNKTSVVTKEVLARRWGIGLDSAQRTLDVTTQRGVRSFLNPMTRRVQTQATHLNFPMIRGGKMYSDTMFAKVKSIRKYTCAQVWTDGQGYTLLYPMISKSEAAGTVSRMVHAMKGIPEVIIIITQ